MSDPKAAIDWVIRKEDSTLSGVITNDPLDNGGTSRFGLTAKYHQNLVAQGFFTTAVPAGRALVMAQVAYAQEYSGPLCLAEYKSQAVCTGVLSFAVLEGNIPAVRVLQTTANSLGQDLVVDGFIGNKTLDAVNSIDQFVFVNAWINNQKNYFDAIVQHSPSQSRFIDGWKNRADALMSLL